MLQLLAKANTEYKCLQQLGQWTTKNPSSELLGVQSKFDVLQTQSLHYWLNIISWNTNYNRHQKMRKQLRIPLGFLNLTKMKTGLSMVLNSTTAPIAGWVGNGTRCTKWQSISKELARTAIHNLMVSIRNPTWHLMILLMVDCQIFSQAKTDNYAITYPIAFHHHSYPTTA